MNANINTTIPIPKIKPEKKPINLLFSLVFVSLTRKCIAAADKINRIATRIVFVFDILSFIKLKNID